MKIAIYQGPEQGEEIDGNLKTLDRQAGLASSQGAGILIAPEMFLTGYNIGAAVIAERAEAVDGHAAQCIAEMAGRHGIAILYGYPERDGGLIYNSAQLIDKTGNARVNYRKTHLFGDIDRNAFSAGEDYAALVELEGWRIGILICYDIEFPENARHLAMQGADLLLVPTALMKPYRFVAEHLVPTRACENQVFVAYANRCGAEQGLEYYGLSCVAGPDGSDLARGDTHEVLLFADLQRNLLDESRSINTYMRDRRSDLYQALTAKN